MLLEDKLDPTAGPEHTSAPLTGFLGLSILAGLIAGGWAFVSGWGLLAAFLAYTCVGSTTLLAAAGVYFVKKSDPRPSA